jgi:hypothetical protein
VVVVAAFVAAGTAVVVEAFGAAVGVAGITADVTF